MPAQLELDEVDRLIGNKRVVHHRNTLINKISSPETERESWTKLLKSKGAILGFIMVITVNIVSGLSFYFIDKKIPLNHLPSTARLIMNNEFVNLPAGNYTLLKTMNAIVKCLGYSNASELVEILCD